MIEGLVCFMLLGIPVLIIVTVGALAHDSMKYAKEQQAQQPQQGQPAPVPERDNPQFWEDQMIEAHLKLVEAETHLRRIHGKEES